MRRPLHCHAPGFVVLFFGFLLNIVLVSPVFAQDMSTSEKVRQADDLSIMAVKRAAEARAMCNCALLKKALESTDKAAILMSEAVADADKTGNLALAQEVYDMATNIVGQAIDLVTEICTYCGRASLDLETVGCFEESCAEAAKTDELNNATIDAALAAGAIPTRPEPVKESAIREDFTGR